MADNYIEKKMEEHRLNSSAKLNKAHHKPQGFTLGGLKINICLKHVAVAIRHKDLRDAIVNRLRSAGCLVSFCSDDVRAGNHLAQSSGARFYPYFSTCDMLSDLKRHWGNVDLLIVDNYFMEDEIFNSVSKTIVINNDNDVVVTPEYLNLSKLDVPQNVTPRMISSFCLYICLEDALYSSSQIITLDFPKGRISE